MIFSKNIELALSAVFKSSNVIMDIYNSENFEIELKNDNSPLTIADIKSNEIINQVLSESGYPILSEEGSKTDYLVRSKWKKFWMIDPIDGTKEFIKRNGEFTINIALVSDNSPHMGVVYAPVLETLYLGSKDIGSYKFENVKCLNDVLTSKAINLLKTESPSTYTIVVSRSHMNTETKKFVKEKELEHEIINTMSVGSSLKICKVSDGSANCYPRFGPTMEWDTAAAHAVAKYAGCLVYNIENEKELLYNKNNLLNPFFIISRQ